MTEPNSAQVAVVPDVRPVNIGVPIKGLDEAFRLAKALAMSGLIPDALKNKGNDVLAIILYGQELGFAPMQAIQAIYVVKGKPQLAAQTWLALVRRAGHRARVVEHTADSCTVEITRGDSGEVHAETFTLEDARIAGLTSNANYKNHPKRMTLARAVSNCARFICPEIALGFYAEGEEFTDDEAVPRPSLAQVAADRGRPANVDDDGVIDAVVVDDNGTAERAAEALRADIIAAEQEHLAAPADVDEVVDAVEVEDPPEDLLALAEGDGWPAVRKPGGK